MSTEEPRTAPTHSPADVSPQALAEARSLGAPMILRGVLGVVFGFVTVFWPRDSADDPRFLSLSTDVVDSLAIAYLVLFALVLVYQALRSPLNVRTPVFGQAVITLPAILFLFLADSPAEVRAAVSIWALLHGLIELWNFRQLKSHPMASDFLIAAGCHVLLGVILIFGGGFDALWILGFTGVAVLIAGVIFIIGGYSRLSRAKQAGRVSIAAAEAAPAEPVETAQDDDDDEPEDPNPSTTHP